MIGSSAVIACRPYIHMPTHTRLFMCHRISRHMSMHMATSTHHTLMGSNRATLLVLLLLLLILLLLLLLLLVLFSLSLLLLLLLLLFFVVVVVVVVVVILLLALTGAWWVPTGQRPKWCSCSEGSVRSSYGLAMAHWATWRGMLQCEIVSSKCEWLVC